jgi:hypothetical protein
MDLPAEVEAQSRAAAEVEAEAGMMEGMAEEEGATEITLKRPFRMIRDAFIFKGAFSAVSESHCMYTRF